MKRMVVICIVMHTILPGGALSAAEPSLELSVREAVETALVQNLGLRLRKEDVAFAEGTAEAAEGDFDTQLFADIGVGGERNNPATLVAATDERSGSWNAGASKRFTSGTEVELRWNNDGLNTDSPVFLFDPVYQNKASVSVVQPLLRGRGEAVQTADLEAARSNLAARGFLVDSEAADLAAQVKNAYWELVFAHQNLEVLQLSLQLAEQLLDETETRIDAGTLALIDLYQPEAQVAQREQDLIGGERAIGVAEDNLKLLLNSDNWLIPFAPSDLPSTQPIEPTIEVVLDNALANRPDIKASEMQIQATEFEVKRTENDTLPALDLFGSAGFGGTADNYGNTFDKAVNDADTQWQLGLRISRPLDNSFARGRYRQSVAQLNSNRTSLALLKQEIRRSVKVTVRDVELALKAIEATTKTALANRKRLEAEQVKFEAGRATTLDVLIAQQDFSTALSTENRARVAYAQTLAELDRIQGIITLDDTAAAPNSDAQ
jgi:outer membrane protein